MNILLHWINKNKKLPSCRKNSNEEFKLFIFYEFCINHFKNGQSDNTYFSIKQFKNLAILLIIHNLDKDIRINGKEEKEKISAIVRLETLIKPKVTKFYIMDKYF